MNDPELTKFFQAQINRILTKPTGHASGPRKPSLSQLETSSKK